MIKVNNLSKVYSNGKGIFDLSFEIEKGEVFGYLGPNGSGKTTTIRNLLGFLNPTGETVQLMDLLQGNKHRTSRGFLGIYQVKFRS